MFRSGDDARPPWVLCRSRSTIITTGDNMDTETTIPVKESNNGMWNADDAALDSSPNLADEHLDADFVVPSDFMNFHPEVESFYVKELGKKVRLRVLTGREVDAYRTGITVGKGQNVSVNLKGMRAKLAVLALANADGSRMFEDRDVNTVLGWPSMVLERIFDRARSMNGLTDNATDTEQGN